MNKYFVFLLLIFGIGISPSCQSSEELKSTQYHQKLKESLIFQIGQEHVPEAKYYSYKSDLRVQAKLIKASPNEEILFTTFEGTNKTMQTYGKIEFNLQGKNYQLLLFRESVGMKNPLAEKQLLLPFTDDTNGSQTYGGGRYMQINTDDIQDDELTVDFNLAYTPWCAFADDYSCPIPPKENHLDIKIKGGEKFKE